MYDLNMMHLRRLLISVTFSLSFFINIVAQNPAHFFIGKDVFFNIHVYSLFQHPNKLLYAATNYGLFVYQNGDFQAIPWLGEHSGNALFSIRLDKDKSLYCANLAGEIFKLEKNGLKSFLKVPELYVGSFFDFGFDSDGHIVICSKNYAIYKDKRWVNLYDYDAGTISSINYYDPSRIILPSMDSSEIYQWHKGDFSGFDPPSIRRLEKRDLYRFCALLDTTWVSVSSSGLFINYNSGYQDRIDDDIQNIYQIDKSEAWITSRNRGVYRLSSNENGVAISEKFFPDLFISTVAQALNGTVYLGTFGKGVIVVPSIESETYPSEIQELRGLTVVDQVLSEEDLTVLSNALVQSVPFEGSTILSSTNNLFYLPGFDFGIHKNLPSLLYVDRHLEHPINAIGTIKDVVPINDDQVILATSNGLIWFGKPPQVEKWKALESSQRWWKKNDSGYRCNAVGYTSSDHTIYYNRQKGLSTIDNLGNSVFFYFDQERVFAYDLFSLDNMLIVATLNKGVLFIENGVVFNQLSEDQGLGSNTVKKVKVKDGLLYVAHRKGFQIYDLKNKQWVALSKKNGVNTAAITNFAIHDQQLWCISGGKLVRVPVGKLDVVPDFQLSIGPVEIGGESRQLTEELVGSYSASDVKVKLDFRGVESEKDVSIAYKLNDGDWKIVPASQPQIEFTNLASGSYTLFIRSNYLGVHGDQTSIPFEIKPPFWQRIWFLIGVIVVVVIMISLFFRRRILKMKELQRTKLEHQALITQKLDAELKALRSQMNPHFIFNSLNSIQDLVLREEIDHSYDYLVLFSRLVRNTLNYSNLDFISISKELEFLEIYLSLEKLRFPKDFEYAIRYDGPDDVQMPSMMIQPFVENTLIHGLMHKKGRKSLDIFFHLNGHLTCTITDNGIGRKQALLIQKRQQGKHTSFAMEAIRQRLDLLNKQFGKCVGRYQVQDLYERGEAVGTKVRVDIPHKTLF